MAKNDGMLLKIVTEATDAVKQIDKIKTSTKNAKKETIDFGKTVSSLGKTLSTAFSTTSITGWIATIKKATDTLISTTSAQTDYIESLNLLNVAYGKTDNSGKELIDTMSEMIGLDQAGLTKTLAQYRQLGTALKIDDDNATKLAENLLKMTQDVSSLYNIDFSEASTKLTSAITGLLKRLARLKPIELLEHLIQGNQQLRFAFWQ